MKNKLLLPYGFQKAGWAILIPTALLGILMMIDGYNGIPTFFYPEEFVKVNTPTYALLSSDTMTRSLNNIVLIGIVVGALFVSCSKEKIEDEMISSLRLSSLLVALYVNYLFLIVAALLVYDVAFLNIMVWNMFTMLLAFLTVFRYRLWRLRKEANDEK